MFGLFKAKTKTSPMTLARAEAIINAFGGVIASNRATIADEALLPCTKEEIKHAIQFCLARTDDPTTVDQLRAGFVMLADFMPMTAQEKAVVARHDEWSLTPPDPSDPAALRSFLETSEGYLPLSRRTVDEGARLLAELNALRR